MDAPALARDIRTRSRVHRALLWAVFFAVHATLFWLNVALSFPQVAEIERTLGDVEIYGRWVFEATEHGNVVGINSPWVYPIAALLPMFAATPLGHVAYPMAWLVLASLVNAIAFAMLLGRGVLTNGRRLAAYWWLGFLLLIGPVTLARLDGLTTAIAIIALLLALRHPRLATVLLTIAAWMKVWPAALVAALVLAHRRRIDVLAVAAVLSAAIVIGCLIAGAGANVFSFISSQSGRGVQVEAPVAVPWLFAAATGDPAWRIEWDASLLTYQVVGPGAVEVAAATTWILVAGVLLVGLIGLLALRRGARVWALVPQLALALLCVLILGNKVGSPQYVVWLVAPVVLGLVLARRQWRLPAIMLLIIAALTQAIYPFWYAGLLRGAPTIVVMLGVKYLLVFGLLSWALMSLWRSDSLATRVHNDLATPPKSGVVA